ncbi:MAG: glycosyltransferase, partial [Akkermansia sp.]|nr:glycosyltransferase [Akkermansia sp.]
IHMDTSGNFEGNDWTELSWYRKIARFLKVKVQDYFRAQHLRYADIVSLGEPSADCVSKRLFYEGWFRDKCYVMPYPVSPRCRYEGQKKKDIILCVGRWDDENQKRSRFLMQTLHILYNLGCSAETRIIGRITDTLQSWHAVLPPNIARRIVLVGFLPNKELLAEYNVAKIVLCTSSFESSHIVSAEGLCSGCSVVTPNRPRALCNLLWYTTRCSGTIAIDDNPLGLANGILLELNAWERGDRDPFAIAEAWQPFFHADKVIEQIFSK